MDEHAGPFLSAAAIRRILEIHPFSEANREYLVREAEEREARERGLAALVQAAVSSPDQALSTPT
ncbi:MAG: hypothetical protein QHJ73_01610 [Armatimonadota bacterium]|nr:hypothetical protein [Armatimonadota bacterium]